MPSVPVNVTVDIVSKNNAAKDYTKLQDARSKLDAGEITQDQYLSTVNDVKNNYLKVYNNLIGQTTDAVNKGIDPRYASIDKANSTIKDYYNSVFSDFVDPALGTSYNGGTDFTGGANAPAQNPGTPGNPAGTPGTSPSTTNRPIYTNTSGYRDVTQQYLKAGKGGAESSHQIDAYANTFKQMFNSAIGRDPTADEYNQFFSSVVINDKPWTQTLDQNQLRQETTGLLNQFYSGEAQKVAEGKAQTTANAAVAPGSAFDVWQNQYRNSINDVSSALQDYQSRLFEKLRPQLLTSLKAQGLLDTGGLNQAFAGAAEDLGNQSQNYLAQAKTGIEADIANQKYGLMSAPNSFQLSNAFNTVPQLTSAGQTALQNVYGNMTNQNMFNQQAALQRELANMQYSNQPSLLSQYGGLILGGAAGGVGQGIGKMIASDRRLKKEILPVHTYLDDLMKLDVVNYKYKNSEQNHLGLIAQDLEKVAPEAVRKVGDFLAIDYNEVVPILIKSIQELNHKLELING